MKNVPVVVTGLGVITSNSQNVDEFFNNCINGQMGIKSSVNPVFDTGKLMTGYWGQIDGLHENEKNHVYRSRILAQKVIDEALADGEVSREYLGSIGNRCALTIGSLSYDDYHILAAIHELEFNAEQEKHSYLTELSDLAVFIKQYCGIKGECYNFSSACAAGTTSLGVAMELIASGQKDIVIACGVDSLSKMIAYGFNSLKALSEGICHPLDKNRDGINIGEGCGVLILESREHAQSRQADIYAECLGYSLGNEAFHITSPATDGSGFYSSMKKALERADILPEELDYVNLHGTGTPINDATELSALDRLYGNSEKKPYVSTLKALIGHCMGAAGALEAVLTVLCIKNQTCFPVFGAKIPMDELKNYQSVHMPIRYALSNSFAFAGNTSSVVLGKVPLQATERSERENHPVYVNGIGILSADIPNILALRVCMGWENADVTDTADLECDKRITNPSTKGVSAKKIRGASHLSKMVVSTALQAEQDAGEDHTIWNPEDVGTVYSSAYGTINDRIEFGRLVIQELPDMCSPTVFSNISPNAPLGHLCISMNCKGTSTSMHGASPLALSKLFIENGSCQQLISCVAEEYSQILETQFAKEGSCYKQPYKESCIELFLKNEPSENTYCRIGEIYSVGVLADPLTKEIISSTKEREEMEIYLDNCYKQMKVQPDAIFVMGLHTTFDQIEEDVLQKSFPSCPILTAATIFGGLQHNSFYANLAIAAMSIKEGRLPECMLNNKTTLLSVLVTGYDACGNYHCVMLYKN